MGGCSLILIFLVGVSVSC